MSIYMLQRKKYLNFLRALWICCTLPLFTAGAFVGYFLFFSPINSIALQNMSQSTPVLQSHPFFHPLVLGLGAPENALSKREGIAWDDARGLELARRINSECQYLSPQYEKALSDYYFGLWKRFPAEMINIYFTKLSISGRHAFLCILGKRSQFDFLVRLVILMPLVLLPGGTSLLVFSLCMSLLPLFLVSRIRVETCFLVSSSSFAATFLQLESAIIYPYFQSTYGSYYIFWVVFMNILAWQAALYLVVYFCRDSSRLGALLPLQRI